MNHPRHHSSSFHFHDFLLVCNVIVSPHLRMIAIPNEASEQKPVSPCTTKKQLAPSADDLAYQHWSCFDPASCLFVDHLSDTLTVYLHDSALFDVFLVFMPVV